MATRFTSALRSAVLMALSCISLAAGSTTVRDDGIKGQVGTRKVELKEAKKFCDLGFRITRTGIDFDVAKLLVLLGPLGLKIEPKLIQPLESLAAVQVAFATHLCSLRAAELISEETYIRGMKDVLQFACDLQKLREGTERATGSQVTMRPMELDPLRQAELYFEYKIEARSVVIQEGGELKLQITKHVQDLVTRYSCQCRLSAH